MYSYIIYMFIYKYIYLYVHFIYIYVCTHTYIYTRARTHTHTRTYISINVGIDLDICVRAYVLDCVQHQTYTTTGSDTQNTSKPKRSILNQARKHCRVRHVSASSRCGSLMCNFKRRFHKPIPWISNFYQICNDRL